MLLDVRGEKKKKFHSNFQENFYLNNNFNSVS